MPDTLTLDPSEVEDAQPAAPKMLSLDPSEVEDVPPRAAASQASPSIDYQHPAGAPGGVMPNAPGVPVPTGLQAPKPMAAAPSSNFAQPASSNVSGGGMSTVPAGTPGGRLSNIPAAPTPQGLQSVDMAGNPSLSDEQIQQLPSAQRSVYRMSHPASKPITAGQTWSDLKAIGEGAVTPGGLPAAEAQNPGSGPLLDSFRAADQGFTNGMTSLTDGLSQLGQAWKGKGFSGDPNLPDVKQGLTKALNGAMAVSVPALAVELGQNPAAAQALAAGILGGSITGPIARHVTKALGGDPDSQDLAATLGAIAGGATAGGLATPKPQPEVISPRYGVWIPRERNLLPRSEPATIDADLPQLASGLVPKQLTSGGSPESAPTPQAPPPAYGPEATQRTHAISVYPQPEVIPPRSGFTAGPDGQIVPTTAGALPQSVDEYSIDSSRQHPVARIVGRDVNGQPIVQRIPGPDQSPAPVVGGIAQRQLPAPQAQPAFSPQPAPQAPPPLNVQTARTRVQPLPSNPTPAPSQGFIAGPDGTVRPVVPQLPGKAPTGADQAQVENFQNYAKTHPYGTVTAYDEATGLPIVKRATQPGNAAASNPAPPAAQIAENQAQPVSRVEPEAGRTVATPAFDPREWSAANPGANVDAAIAEARRLGHQIVGENPRQQQSSNSLAVAQKPETASPDIFDSAAGSDFTPGLVKSPGAAGQAETRVRSVPTQDLTLDPQRFQYKMTGPGGVTGLLKGRRWNDDLAGVISVWRDPADGKTYVVNGHHRAMLAKETGTPSITVRYLDAPDAASARATGALQNIAEGRGTALDAAKFFRDSGLTPADLDAKGISMGEATAANGVALARLSPQLFNDAVAGRLRMGRAIAIGKAAQTPEQQEALVKLISRAEARGRKVSDDTIEELGRMVRGAGAHTETQNTLFGAQEQTRNLALEKADVSQYIRETLSKERKLFAHVSDQVRAEQLGAAGNQIKPKVNAGIAERAAQAQEIYDRLSTRTGAVNDILDRAASRLARGEENADTVKREAYNSARAAMAEALRNPEGSGVERVQEDSGRGRPTQTEASQQPNAVDKTEPALPGFEKAVREQSDAQAEERGNQLTSELKRPKGDIEKAAGEMERKSPLFEGSEANPQSGLFGGLEERHGGLGAVDPTRLIPSPVRDYLAHEAELIGKSRELHGGIYDLAEQHDADVLRANKLMKELPGTPADQEAVYHHLENPKEPITRVQREILDKLAPFNRESARIYQKLNPEKKLVPGYVHRIAQQKGSLLDRILQGSKSTGRGNLLKKSASASKKRSMLAIQDKDGTRVPVSVSRGRVTAWHDNVPTDIGPLRAGLTNPEEILDERLVPLDREEKKLKQEQRTLNETPSRQAAAGRRLQNIANRLQEIESERTAIEHEHTAENLPDKLWRDKNGDQWTFKQVTTREIERHTPIEYYKNAAASTVTNWLELRKAERAADYIEKVKSDPEFSHFGIKPSNPSQIPDGWQSTRLPQFQGYYFEPHVAEVFDQYAKQLAQGKPGILQQVGDFLTTAIFLNPLSHIPNLTTNWFTEKGISVANPLTWGPEFKAGAKAFSAVVHQNQDFLDALDAGAPMQSQKRAVREFSDLLIKKLQDEAAEPSVSEKIASALGNIVNVPAAMRAVVNFMADKSTWPVHDMYFLQSAYSKMGKNPSLTLKQALEDTAKYIPDERLPTRIFNSKAVADVMQDPMMTIFSRYHYGILKGYGQVLKNLSDAGFKEESTSAKGEPVNKAGRTAAQEKAHALNIAAGLALMLGVVYPALDQLAIKETGNKDARVRRAGYTNFADALSRAIHGDITPLQAARSVATPAVLTETGVDLAANRDVFGTGRKIYDPHADKKVIAEQVGRRLAESVSPAQLAMRASESSLSAKKTLLSLIGISFPRHGALKLAAELNADRMGDQAETSEQREKGILRSQARYSAWQGDMSGIEEAKKSGLFTPQDIRKLEHEAKENPLLYEARIMPVDDVLKVWAIATPEERRTLLPLLARKGSQINSMPRDARAGERARWQKALAGARQPTP